jgi:spore coat protein U-like protein
MIRLFGVVAAGLAAMLSASAALACGNLDMNLQPPSFLLNQNSFPQIGIQVSRTKINDDCSYFVTFGYGDGGAYTNRALSRGPDKYPVQFWKDRSRSQILKDIGDAASLTDVIADTFTAAGEKVQTKFFYPAIEPETFKRFGMYSDTFAINLYEGTLNGPRNLKRTVSFNLRYNQPRTTAVSLVGTGEPFDQQDTFQKLDFGTMEQGETLSCDLVFAHNAGYRLYFRSENKGRMKRVGSQRAYVDYTMRVNNRPVEWHGAGNTLIDSGAGVSPPTGRRYAISTTLGEVSAAPAGEYTDMVTIQIVAVE